MWPCYCDGGLHQISVNLCYILTVGVKAPQTSKIKTCQNFASPVCILFHINYEIESLEVYLVMKIPSFTIEVLHNDFNVSEGILRFQFSVSPRKTHTIL
jgi:hypothetical protein